MRFPQPKNNRDNRKATRKSIVLSGRLTDIHQHGYRAVSSGRIQHCYRDEVHVSEDINVLALVKGEEKYIFLFDDKNRSETLRTLGRYASDSELNFSWYDAAVLSQKIRDTTKKCEVPRFDMPSVTDSIDGEDFTF